jgi:hypothetical protein
MIFRIFRKELLDTLRDRRTLMTMLVIPILVFPITLNVFIAVSESFEESANSKTMKIGIVGDHNKNYTRQLEQIPSAVGPKKIIVFKDSLTLRKAIEADRIQLGLIIPTDESTLSAQQQTIALNWLLDASEVGRSERANLYGSSLQSNAEKERLHQLGLRAEQIKPMTIQTINCASDKKMVGQLAGGILPYIFIAFGFIGCMYPAIDLFTGEKERGTIETLLTVPVGRWKILIGKMLVVVSSGMLAASCSKQRTTRGYSWNFNTLFHRIYACPTFATCYFLCRRHDSNCYLRQEFQRSAKHHYTAQYCHGSACNGGVFPWDRTQPQYNPYPCCECCARHKRTDCRDLIIALLFECIWHHVSIGAAFSAHFTQTVRKRKQYLKLVLKARAIEG